MALHFVRFAPRRFAFLGKTPLAFSVEPAFPTYTEAVYTFPASFDRLLREARAELGSAGYRMKREGKAFYAERDFFVDNPGSSWLVEQGVTIQPGRAIGSRFNFDAYDVVSQSEAGWVTVIIDQPERLPFWVKLFVP